MYGIFMDIYHKNQPNVGKYTSPMDPMGHEQMMFLISDGLKRLRGDFHKLKVYLEVWFLSY